MEPTGPSLCGLGPQDILPQEAKAESFMALRLESETLLQLKIEKYHIDDYDLDRKEAGYICEKEGLRSVRVLLQLNNFHFFIELWGCPTGYMMNQGHCYKLFRELKDYTDAMFKCQEEKGVLAEPKTFTQAEFLESLVSHADMLLNKTDSFEKTIFLGYRLDDLEDSTFFEVIKGHGDGDYAIQNGDCVVMSMDNFGNHKGWMRQPCNTLSHFICQTSNNN